MVAGSNPVLTTTLNQTTMKKKNIFEELYIIKFEYQKEDGFYETSEAEVLVDVFHGVNEKSNHDKAENKFLLENKNLKNLTIKCVTYV